MLYLAPRIAPGAAIHPTSPSSAPAIITVPPLVIAMWRIRVEEKALLATVNGCQAYAERHKRLIPFIWQPSAYPQISLPQQLIPDSDGHDELVTSPGLTG